MRFVRYWLPMIGWMAVIFFLSGRSSVQVADEPLLNFIFFKTLHVIEYSILYILTLRALRQSMHFMENWAVGRRRLHKGLLKRLVSPLACSLQHSSLYDVISRRNSPVFYTISI